MLSHDIILFYFTDEPKMVCKKVALVFMTMISAAFGEPNKTSGYYEYKYSMQRDLLVKKEKEFSRCCPPLSKVNFKHFANMKIRNIKTTMPL